MPTSLIVVCAVVGVLLLWFLLTYNGLIGRKNRCENAFASIDVNLKKRHDLIPNLVAACEGFMTHERELFTEVATLRERAMHASGVSAERATVESALTGLLGQIQMRAEAYPELKSGENFLHLQRTLTELEEQISASRRAYNAAVESFNNAVEMMPSSIVAGMMNYDTRPFFRAEAAERENVRI